MIEPGLLQIDPEWFGFAVAALVVHSSLIAYLVTQRERVRELHARLKKLEEFVEEFRRTAGPVLHWYNNVMQRREFEKELRRPQHRHPTNPMDETG